MAENETGWTNKAPNIIGFYWMRNGEYLDLVEVGDDGWLRGFKLSDRVKAFASGWEWLGPISPSDFEQLTRLREAAALCAIPYEALLADWPSRRWIAPEVWRAIEDAVTALREALAQRHTGGKKS